VGLFRKLHMNIRRREALFAYLFISPWIIGFIILTFGPMLVSLYYSFTEYNLISPPQWVGLENYIRLFFKDPLFWKSLQVTLYYAALSLPLGLTLSFIIAILLNQKIPFVNIWRTIYFLPSVISGVGVTLLGVRIFNPRVGLLAALLSTVGIKAPNFLQDSNWIIPALVMMGLWGIGGGMIIYLAGLQGVPTDLYDAAKVDGANIIHRFRFVTLPMTTPVIFYNLVMDLISTFQYFTTVYVATGGTGGPNRASLFYNLYLYQNAFKFNEMGYASTMAWVLFLIVISLTLLIFRSSTAWVYYEGQLRGRI
jgi:multiple sugar transport system permease protein